MSDEKVYEGVVIWFSKAYGFIEWYKDGVRQKDLFCHFSDIVYDGYKTLLKDQKVQFSIGQNHHGDPKAVSIRVITN
jgi:cold shock CspA family protein